MSQDWKHVCGVAEIPMLGARVVQREGMTDVAVFRTDGDRVFAVLDRCPHKGGQLSQGMVFGDRVACPMHNWQIELHSGCAASPDEGCVKKFSVKVEAGEVYLDADELAAAP